MGGAAIVGIMFAVVALLVVVGFIGTWNRLVRWRNEAKNGWAQIDVQLKRRYDLIPNLVETVKGYARHEKEIFERIAQYRGQAMAAQGINGIAEANAGLTGALRGLIAIAESYPQLKANENFKALQEELSSTENKISFARQYYNDTVARYNSMIQSIPSNIVAGMGGFAAEAFFNIPEIQKEAPKVQF